MNNQADSGRSLEGHNHALQLWDTVADEGYDRLRPLSYPGTDVFVLCFSLGDRSTLSNLTSRWSFELLHFSGAIPWLVVGLWTFEYRKHGGNEGPDVSPEQVSRTLSLLRGRNRCGVAYVVCDARYDENLQPIVDNVSRSSGVKCGN